MPKGLAVDLNRSTIIESPAVKAARLFYKGRIEPDSLSVAWSVRPDQAYALPPGPPADLAPVDPDAVAPVEGGAG